MAATEHKEVLTVRKKDALKCARDEEEFIALSDGFFRSINSLTQEYLDKMMSLFKTYKDIAALYKATVVLGISCDVKEDLVIGAFIGSDNESTLDKLSKYIKGIENEESL